MLEALLLAALHAGTAPHAEARRAPPPSLELLEFLGEFGDDEDGLFEDEDEDDAADNARGRAAAKPPATPPAKTPATPPRTEDRS